MESVIDSSTIKQVIVMRKDLNMRKGKMIAQGAHASMGIFFDLMKKQDNNYVLELNNDMQIWKDGVFTKICLYVESEQELSDIYLKAQFVGLPVKMIVDSGLTEFKNIPTKTCLAIGPAKSELIDKITGKLKLL